MWIYTKTAFLSIVEDKNSTASRPTFLVRGRFKGDIESMFPEAKVIEGAGTDYLYRAFMDRDLVVSRVRQYMAEELDYTNFKNSVENGPDRQTVYGDVWLTMLRAQDDESESKDKKQTERTGING
jgi:hypothetical protein